MIFKVPTSSATMFKRFFLTEKNILIAIILNAILIFIAGFPKYGQLPIWVWCEIGFILFFIIEVVVKVREYGWKTYFEDNFNRLDFFVVVASLPFLLSFIIPTLRFNGLILFRLLRLLRLSRLFAFVPNMAQLLVGLKRAFKSSVFVLAALLLYIFVLSIVTCELFGEVEPKYFGDPFISFYTTFQLFTLEGWNEIADSVAENSEVFNSALARIYFMAVVLSGGIFGISLANAVFVDEMTIDNNITLEKKMEEMIIQMEEMRKLLEDKK